MEIHTRSETEIELSRMHEPGFETAGGASASLDSMALFAASVALCTHAVLTAYGQRVGADARTVSMRVRWQYGERPRRIEDMEMTIIWPALPESRLDAATRAAHQCTLHNTLREGLEVDTLVSH